MKAPPRRQEARRLEVLREYQLLDTPREAAYDAFARAAAKIAGTPISLISLIDSDRQWFKSRVGLDAESTPRDQAFCAHAIETDAPLIVDDASTDERFAQNPLVTGEPAIRFYAGFPLFSPDGYGLGTLCVIDREPRKLTAGQESALLELSLALRATLDGRRQLLQIFRAACNELYHYDLQSARFTFASRGALDNLGFDLAELDSLKLTDVFPDMGGARLEAALRDMRAGEPFICELNRRSKDGAELPVEVRCELNRASGREQMFIVAASITQRRAAQEQIDVLLSALDVAGDSILVYEAGPDGLRVTYANVAFYDQTGYDRSEVVGCNLESFRKQMPDDAGMQQVRAAIAAGMPVSTDVCSYRKDGRSFWNRVTMRPVRDSQGQIAHWISVEHDVTQSVERESALENQNLRLAALGEAARELFDALDFPSLTRRFETAVRALTGALVTVHAIESVPFSDPLLAQAVTQNRSVAAGDHRRFALPAGSSHVVELNSAQVLTGTALVQAEVLARYFAVAARNAALVSEIEEQRNAVLELNQVKTDLITMLAHDFKGPLTNILGYAELTAEMGELNGHQQEYLDSIRRAALHLADLATDTLALSRLERNEIELNDEIVDLRALLLDVIAANDRERIDLDVRTRPSVRGDTSRLRQVFYNLIENAVKYSPGGGRVKVVLDSTGDQASVEVTDSGIGIPAKDLTRIFDRFSRAPNARKMRIAGTGFGLYLANQIAQMHGGSIEVKSVEGVGSAFRLLLPISGEHLPRPLRVAVLEGESEARSFITHALREAGLRARLLHSPEALLDSDMFETDRIVVDLDAVPLQTAQRAAIETFARSHNAGLIVIAADPPESGYAHILRKPYLMRDLVALVQTVETTRSTAE